jgi:hypothetical protein
LTVFNFEHYGNRGIRLYFKDETSVFREACWDQIGDEAREDSSYFLGGYSIPASGKASISAIAWLDDELEMRVYVGTGKRIFERRYSGGWMWFEKSLEEGAEEGHISALRWGSGFASVYSVGRDGLVEIVRADGSWTRTRILSKSACRGIDCPLRREPLESSALMPMPPPQQLLPELPNTPPEQVQDLAPEPEDLDSIEQGPQQHEPGGPFLTFAGVCKHYVARPVMAAAAVAIVTVVAAKALWLWQLQRRQRL